MATNQDINQALMEDIMAIYNDAEIKMLSLVAKRVAKGIKSEGWNEQKLKSTQELNKEIQKVLNSTSKLSKAKVSKGIIDAYKNGVKNVETPKGMHETVLDELDIPMNLKMMVLDTNNLLDNASFQVLRNANDAYRQIMANSTTGLLAGTDTRIQASQKMLNEFASKGITTFVDKSGRHWDLSSYAEMCARTVGSHAALQGHIDRQIEVGEDLVKVSSIGTTCPICQRWQGVVLSISGNSPKYHGIEEAKAAGLFHPNCKHTLVMYIPELDDNTSNKGKVEPSPINYNTLSSKRNALIEKQRAYERGIRYWKKREALAITPEEKEKCKQYIKKWQYKNLLHCTQNNLRRQYAREGVMSGYANGPKGTVIGGSLKEYEAFFKDVVGDNAKSVYLKFGNLQFFGEEKPKFEKWLKDEITSLDQLDIEKAMMKDSSNKEVTPTSLYKKYIGDNPGKDYVEVSPYEKGTKEYKSGYAKWLKEQIEEIGVSYNIKPKYVDVHISVADEDLNLSATEMYKKYHDGKAPTQAFKEAGGEEVLGMKYGKWVESQKKALIKHGTIKTVPFENAESEKTASTISKAESTINASKTMMLTFEYNKYLKELDDTVHGNYDGYLKVKESIESLMKIVKEATDNQGTISNEEIDLAYKKMDAAEAKHLEMVKKKAEKTYNSLNDKSLYDLDIDKLKGMLNKEENGFMKTHIKKQIEVYEEVKKSNDPLAKYSGLQKWDVDDAIYKMENNKTSELQGKVNYYNFLLQKNDATWEHYNQVKLLSELYQEALAGTLGMTEAEKLDKDKKKKEEQEKKKALKKNGVSGVITLGREASFKEGKLVKSSDIYQELDYSDLDILAKQASGNQMMKADRRDVLGRDKIDGHNHHRGHDIALKSDSDPKLGKAMQLFYDEYINTIKCGPINDACVAGYEQASPSMKKKIDAIDKVINSCEIDTPVKLHRFISDEVANKMFGKLDLSDVTKGKLIESPAFMSTTVSGHPTFEKRNFMMTIQCDKGTHMFPTLNYEEGEVLLGRNGKLEIVDIIDHSKDSKKLKHYDGSEGVFKGKEIVVRYIEEGKSIKYDVATPEKIDSLLNNSVNINEHTEESKDWIKSLNRAERKASDKYTGSWYGSMNDVYRRNKRGDEEVVKYSEDLTNALRRAETKQPVVLRRGLYYSDVAHMLGFNGDESEMKKAIPIINQGGYAAEDKGFLSTSPYPKGGFDKQAELRIYCPSGTHAAYVDSISSHKGEKETILNSGSIYKVLKIDYTPGSGMIVYLELLGTD